MEQEKTYQLVDAQESHLRNPKTFKAPRKVSVLNLKEGSMVTLKVRKERFKVRLNYVSEEKMIGKIQTKMLPGTTLAEGQLIEFSWKNVLATSAPETIFVDKFLAVKGKMAFDRVGDGTDDVRKSLGVSQDRAEYLSNYAVQTVQNQIDAEMNKAQSSPDPSGFRLAKFDIGDMIALSCYPCETPQEVALITYVVPQMARDIIDEQDSVHGIRAMRIDGEDREEVEDIIGFLDMLFGDRPKEPMDDFLNKVARAAASRGRADD